MFQSLLVPLDGSDAIEVDSHTFSLVEESLFVTDQYIVVTSTPIYDDVHTILRYDLDGSNLLTLYSSSSFGGIGAMLLVGDTVLIGTDALKSTPLAGGGLSTIEGSRGYSHLTLAGDEVLATSGDAIWSVSLDGSRARQVVATTGDVWAIAFDDRYVYWLEYNYGSKDSLIRKAAR